MELIILFGIIAALCLVPLAMMAGGLALLVRAMEKIFYNK